MAAYGMTMVLTTPPSSDIMAVPTHNGVLTLLLSDAERGIRT